MSCKPAVDDTSRLHDVKIQELRLLVGANVTLVVRNEEGFVSPQRTRDAPRRPVCC